MNPKELDRHIHIVVSKSGFLKGFIFCMVMVLIITWVMQLFIMSMIYNTIYLSKNAARGAFFFVLIHFLYKCIVEIKTQIRTCCVFG